jgi:non-canonical (house-cleaning) NTP pyrophosphatase
MDRSPWRPSAALLAATLLFSGCGARAKAPLEPEEKWAYAISTILVGVEQRGPAAALQIVTELMEKLERGADFGELAAARSEDPLSRAQKGFIGFVNPHQESRFSGAVQTLSVGQLAGPVETQPGYQILYRHSFEEGRRLEQKWALPVYGFLVSARNADEGEPRSPEEAQKIAEEAWRMVHDREIDLEQAARRFGDGGRPRPLAFLGFVGQFGDTEPYYRAATQVPPGGLAPLVSRDGKTFAVLVRGRYHRSIVRHILILHKGILKRDPSITRTPDEAVELARQIIAKLDPAGANWTEMVTRYSDDPGTARLNGGLGTFTNGELPPDMEAVVLETEPGKVAQRPAVTEDGVHVVWSVK